MNEDNSKKKAWQKPENWFTWGGLALVGFAVLKGLDYIMPLLNRVLENLVYTVALGGVLAVFAYVAFSKDFHRLAWYGYKAAMKWVTRRFVEIDPIAILHIYVESLKENMETIRKSLGDLRGQARLLTNKLSETKEKFEKSMGMVSEAQARVKDGQKGMKSTMILQSRKAGRLEKSGVTYQGLLNKLNAHISVTEKIKEAAEFMIADIEDTVEEETEKRNMIQASHKAMTASRRILDANNQREMYDMAMESITTDYYNKLGEIEQFMEDSQNFINTMDLENGVFEEDALSKLDEWQKRSESLLEGGSGKTKYRVAPGSVFASSVAAENEILSDEQQQEKQQEKEKRQSFADLYDKLDS